MYYKGVGLRSGSDSPDRAAAKVAGAEHAYVRVKTDKYDKMIEIYGPNEGDRTGRPMIDDFKPTRPYKEKRTVATPYCAEDPYAFENAIMAEFMKYKNDPNLLPG